MTEHDYLIVRNAELQYAIWPAFRRVPEGWEAVGEPASRDACLSRIDTLWTDMRPLSLVKALAADEATA